MAAPNIIAELKGAEPHSGSEDADDAFTTFSLPGFTNPKDSPETVRSESRPDPQVLVQIPKDLDKRLTPETLLAWEPFKEWVAQLNRSLALQQTGETGRNGHHAFHDDPYSLKSILIQSVDFFGPRIGFLKLSASMLNKGKNNKGKPMSLPGVIFMRGGSVGMLMILRPRDASDERWVIMTRQARLPAGSLSFLEIPAGMIDEKTGDFKSAALREIEEETGLTINPHELTDMTELALRGSPNPENLRSAMYPSPGGSDEFIALFLWEKEMERLEMESLREKLTGDKKQGEMITLDLIPYADLWKVATRDGKTMVAWALYESLKRAGVLDDYGNVIDKEAEAQKNTRASKRRHTREVKQNPVTIRESTKRRKK